MCIRDRILNEGSTLSLQVGVSGSEPLSVNWFKGISNVGEGTLLVKEDISLTDSGFYYAEISNDAGTIRGDLIEVQVRQPVEIVSFTESIEIIKGQSGVISVDATGTKPINYQWFKNGKSISGATGSSLNISIASANDSGLYSVLVENSFSAASSGSINVSVVTPPVIQSELEDEILIVGSSVEKVAQVSGSEPLV